jgi:hypothetical protein
MAPTVGVNASIHLLYVSATKSKYYCMSELPLRPDDEHLTQEEHKRCLRQKRTRDAKYWLSSLKPTLVPLPVRAVRWLRKLQLKLFGGDLPHWAKDALKLVTYVSFLRLIPTLHMVVFYPRHFFKVVPAIVKGAKASSYYLTPIQFVVYLAAFQAFALAYVPGMGAEVDKTEVLLFNFALVAAFPFLAVAACLAVIVTWLISSRVWGVHFIAREIRFNVYGALVPVDPATYLALNWKRYLWSMFYYYLYFYLMVLIATACFIALEGSTLYFLAGTHGVPSRLKVIPLFVVAFVVSIAAYWMFVRPYVLLLVESARYDTATMEKFFIVEEQPLLRS